LRAVAPKHPSSEKRRKTLSAVFWGRSTISAPPGGKVTKEKRRGSGRPTAGRRRRRGKRPGSRRHPRRCPARAKGRSHDEVLQVPHWFSVIACKGLGVAVHRCTPTARIRAPVPRRNYIHGALSTCGRRSATSWQAVGRPTSCAGNLTPRADEGQKQRATSCGALPDRPGGLGASGAEPTRRVRASSR